MSDGPSGKFTPWLEHDIGPDGKCIRCGLVPLALVIDDPTKAYTHAGMTLRGRPWGNIVKCVLLLFFGLLWPTLAYSHDSPLDAYGCHSNKALLGSSTKRECHTGLLAGQVFASITAEYKAMIAALQTELAKCKATICPTPVLKQIGLSWTANTEPDLAGYRVYCGNQSKVYSIQLAVAKTVRTATVPNLPSGTYYCAVTASDQTGNESDFSQEVSKVIP